VLKVNSTFLLFILKQLMSTSHYRKKCYFLVQIIHFTKHQRRRIHSKL